MKNAGNGTEISILMDIQENYRASRLMYFSTLLPIGLIVLLLSFLVLGGTKYQTHGLVFSGIFVLSAFAVVILTKFSLLHMKTKELSCFAHHLDGQITEN